MFRFGVLLTSFTDGFKHMLIMMQLVGKVFELRRRMTLQAFVVIATSLYFTTIAIGLMINSMYDVRGLLSRNNVNNLIWVYNVIMTWRES